MKIDKDVSKDIYYTNDHDWIEFQDRVAYIGICGFKLIGFKKVHQLFFQDTLGFYNKGEIIATVIYGDYQVEVRMPVDGELLKVNETLRDHPTPLIQQPEGNGWLALITPARPNDRSELLTQEEYKLKVKNNFDKP